MLIFYKKIKWFLEFGYIAAAYFTLHPLQQPSDWGKSMHFYKTGILTLPVRLDKKMSTISKSPG
jgi:hypothetical protein